MSNGIQKIELVRLEQNDQPDPKSPGKPPFTLHTNPPGVSNNTLDQHQGLPTATPEQIEKGFADAGQGATTSPEPGDPHFHLPNAQNGQGKTLGITNKPNHQ